MGVVQLRDRADVVRKGVQVLDIAGVDPGHRGSGRERADE